MPFDVPLNKLVSRVAHTVGGAYLFAVLVGPYIFEDLAANLHAKIHHKYVIACTLIVALSGVYNAYLLEPKKMKEKAGKWRGLVYGGKLTLLLAMTPLTDKIVSDYSVAHTIKLASAVAAFALGGYARFYREQAVASQQ